MERWLPRKGFLKFAMFGAVVAVFLLAYLDLCREQARALDDFVAEQTALARLFAETLSARLEGIVRDLDATAEISESDSSGTSLEPGAATKGNLFGPLTRLVDLGGPCIEVALFRSTGELLADVAANQAKGRLSSAALVEAHPELFADLHPAVVKSSGPLQLESSSDERFRLLSLRRNDRIVVFLVDTNRLFADLRGVVAKAARAPIRWLVLDDARRLVELTSLDGGSPSVVSSHPIERNEEVAKLLASMAEGRDGAALLSRAAAASLDLGHRMAVAGFAPVHTGGGQDWSVAVVASAMRVRDRALFAAFRLGAATGLASLLVALFGLVVSRHERREQRLADALHLAEATSALRERSEKMVEVIPVGRNVGAKGRLADALPHTSAGEIATLEALVLEAKATRKALERSGLRFHLGTEDLRDVDVFAIPLGRPLPDGDCFLVLHDRTEIRILERNLARAEKLATIGTLAAGVAHEIGTPLGIISGRAEQLLARFPEGDGSEQMRKNVTSILSQVDKVSTTIRQLLDFSRVRPIAVEAVTPTQALGSVSALLEHRFRQAKVNLSMDAPVSVASVAADPGQLEQVLVNLLLNACDACLSGGQVRVRAAQQGDQVVFEISDDGAGISPEHLPLVFDPFFTTKKRGQGTGLGLTIAADIVKNHGGALELDSVVGEGTTVRVRMPKAEAVRQDSEGARS